MVYLSGVATLTPERGAQIADFWELTSLAAVKACADAGVGRPDVDGLILAQSGYSGLHADFPTTLAQRLGITPGWMEASPHGGQQILSTLWRARAAIESGMAATVVVVAADNRKSRLSNDGVVTGIARKNMDTEFEYPYGCVFPSAMALVARRYMHHYGVSEAELSAVAVAQRKWAALHPDALLRDPLSLEEAMASRYISTPLKRSDLCLITDGAAALVVTAEQTSARSVVLGGVGDNGASQFVSYLPMIEDLSILRRAADTAYRQAGITSTDVDIVYPYDPSTFHVCWALEQLGICSPGEGGKLVASGATEPGGSVPVNTHGGLLSYGHPGLAGGMFAVVEAVEQLRKEAGQRQVPNAEVAMLTAMGGFMTMGAAILTTAR
jgi:acetyl-CoA acetyltransferase